MNGTRRVALAAAFLGLGLAFYRPRLVPTLHPGTGDGEAGPSRRRILGRHPEAPPAAQDAGAQASAADWRDAPADRSAFSGGHEWNAARRAAHTPGYAGARRQVKENRQAPSAALVAAEPRGASAGTFCSSAAPGGPTLGPGARGCKNRTPSGQARRAPAVQTAARPRPPSPWARSRLVSKFFTGPVPPDDEEDAGDENDRPVSVRRDDIAKTGDDKNGAVAARFARIRRIFPLFRPPRPGAGPPRRSADKARDPGRHRRRVRPPRLARLLGNDAWRPPKSAISPPDLSHLDARRPKTLPDGGTVPERPFELKEIEALDPTRAGATSDRRRAPHWHPEAQPLGPEAQPPSLGTKLLWHSGAARGLIEGDRWLWLWRDDSAAWWAAPPPGGAALPPPKSVGEAATPLLRHQGLWWSKQLGVWFALHEGELWSWRRFSQWDAEGLLRLVDGASIVYSADFSRVAVIVPDEGAVLYDAATGVELGRWREDELPRRHPHPPKDLRLPRGI